MLSAQNMLFCPNGNETAKMGGMERQDGHREKPRRTPSSLLFRHQEGKGVDVSLASSASKLGVMQNQVPRIRMKEESRKRGMEEGDLEAGSVCSVFVHPSKIMGGNSDPAV